MANRWGWGCGGGWGGWEWKEWQTLFSWTPKSLQMVTVAMKLKYTCVLEEKAMTNLDRVLESRGITLPTNICIIKAMVFPVVKYRCDSWTIKNAERLRTDPRLLEETLESPFDIKKIKSVNAIGNQSWIFIGRSVAEAEAPILWPPDAKSQLTGKDSDAGKGQDEKAVREDGMVGWHRWLNGLESEQIQGDSKGQGSLACCSPWGHKESDMT